MDSISVELGGHRLCGTKLSRYGDQIVDLTGLGGLWIGVVLMAGATSLPELFIDVSAALIDTPDLAAGDLFGSNAFNMAVFFFVDVAYRSGPLFNSVSDAHAITALWSILLMSIALMGIIYRVEKRYMLIEPASFVIIFGYCLGLCLLFQ